jgi:hypothetical protein
VVLSCADLDGDPSQDVVNDKAQARYDIKYPEQRVVGTEHQWEYADGYGNQHDPFIDPRPFIVAIWLDNVDYLF